MSVGMNVWFRSGVGDTLRIECLGESVEKPKLLSRKNTQEFMAAWAAVKVIAAPDVEFPDEDFRYSVLPIHDHYSRMFSVDTFNAKFPALNIVNEFTFYIGAGSDLDPRNPLSKFWVNNKSVQSAGDVAAAFQRIAADVRQGLDRTLFETMLTIDRRPADPYGDDDSEPTDEQHLDRLIGEAEAFANHCLWFVSTRAAPVLVSLEVQT